MNDMVMFPEETVMLSEGSFLIIIAEKARKIRKLIEKAFRSILKPFIA